MTTDLRERIFRALSVLAAISSVWAVGIALTGGFVVDAGLIRISSRNPRNAGIIAAVSAALACVAATPARRRRILITAKARLIDSTEGLLRGINSLSPRVADLVAAATCAAVVIVGVVRGSHIAGAGDSYAYASQADLWASGRLRIEQPLMADLPWPFAREALAPLGYRPALRDPAIVPVYGAGLPMVMAVFSRLAGRSAVFYVVPILGGLAVWATYLMGRRFAGAGVGAAGAALMASSPVFLYQLVQPMSDVPVTAWWALTLTLVGFGSPSASLWAGLSAGAAIVTRANLAPLAVVVAAFLVWKARRDRRLRQPLLFGIGLLPGCLVTAALNAHWYGSPFANGYGAFDYLYQTANFGPNLKTYPRWLLESQTPIVALALAAPFFVPRSATGADREGEARATTIMWLAFIIAVFGCYVFYAPFDAWWYLRFLLPAFPPMMVLVAVGIVSIVTRVAGPARLLAAAALVGGIACHGFWYAKSHAAFDLRDGEQKYAAIGRYIAARLPERGVFLSVQHSGSVRYYSGRLTVRYDWIEPKSLESAIDDLRRRGYQPYFVLDEEEEEPFKARFAGTSAVGAIDWPPIARLQRTPTVNIYDPSQAGKDGPRNTNVDIIPNYW
jgi:hypothetical protein